MPTIDVFVTTILSNPQLRGRHERVRRALTSARVAYAEHDVAGDEAAKSMWKRKNGGKNELPFILIDGEPVGNIEDLDEAVEFGELRQFLRLDTPSLPPSSASSIFVASPTPAAAASSHSPLPPSASSSSSPASTADSHPKPQATLDDFADLDLTESELEELAREISRGETFSSGLGSSHDSTGAGYDFSMTQRFEPIPQTQPLRFEKVNFTRPLPDRPLASEIVKDELEGIDAEELDMDELEKLAKELEEEEIKRRRLRDAQGDTGWGDRPPPLPEKQAAAEKEPPAPQKDRDLPTPSSQPEAARSPSPARSSAPESSAPTTERPTPSPPTETTPALVRSADPSSLTSPTAALDSQTSVSGLGGASLSAPMSDIDKLRLADDDADDDDDARRLVAGEGQTLQVAPVSALERQLGEEAKTPTSHEEVLSNEVGVAVRPASGETVDEVPSRPRSHPAEVQRLKERLDRADLDLGKESEVPAFSRDMLPDEGGGEEEEKGSEKDKAREEVGATKEDERGAEGEGLAERVAEAIRVGEL
ncbi:hypothetical protein JCM21900_004570 [Sporobolomyces salmonicolor]